jgi:signal transduction histidine kinase
MRPYSLTRRLVITVLLVELGCAVLILAGTVIYERHTHFRSFDVMLRGRADSLLGAVQDAEDPGDSVMLDGTEVNLPREDVYEVRDATNKILGRSRNWPGPTDAQLVLNDGGFFRLHIQGRHYRALKTGGVRVVDPGDKGGGTRRNVTIFYGAPTDSVWAEVWNAVEFYAVTSVILLALSGVVIFWLLNRGLAPLRELAAEAEGISVKSWNFAPSEDVRRTKELAPLAVALETALGGLERSFVQQRQFVSDAAHELKTAVAVVKSSLQLLIMRQRTVPEYEAGLERCESDCERMEEIVGRMLMLATVESSEADSGAASFTTDLAICVRRAAEQLATMARVKQVHVALTGEEAVMVNVEPGQLQLVCSNLILNALQHSAAGGEVKAVVLRDGGAAELRIGDCGNGIEPEALPRVFDRFYRSDASRSRNTGGSGLGLAICKAIVTKFRGDIRIDSTPGEGTSVIVRLPMEPPGAHF